MARLARGETINPAKTQVLHCIQRCVRRAFLCGEDAVTGQSFEHRQGWIRNRLEFLATIFGIDYLQLLDWTGRAIRTDKRGSIPAHLAPLLTRIGVNSEHWYEVVTRFGKLFKRAAGSAENLAAEAQRRGVRWLQGPGARLLSAASG